MADTRLLQGGASRVDRHGFGPGAWGRLSSDDVTDSTPAAPGAASNAPTDDTPEQLRIRREKRERILAQGQEAYPVSVDRTHTLAQIRAEYPELEPDTATGVLVGVVGLVTLLTIPETRGIPLLQEQDRLAPEAG